MKNILKAILASFMWLAFMMSVEESMGNFEWYFFVFSGAIFFNIIFQSPRGKK